MQQGSCISPIRFNLCREWLSEEALEVANDYMLGGRIEYVGYLMQLAKFKETLST